MSATIDSSSVRAVLFTDGRTEIMIHTKTNEIEKKLLERVYAQKIVGLECIEKHSNVRQHICVCTNGLFPVVIDENMIFKIIPGETSSTSNTLEQSIQEDNRTRIIREKSLTPTNTLDRSEFNKVLSSVDEKLDKFSRDVKEKIDSLTNVVKLLYELVQPIIVRAIDPWEITARSLGSSDASLSQYDIIKFYKLSEDECMVCGQSRQVVNAHIWPKHTHGEHLLSMFDLTTDDLNNPRNYLRFCKSLETAFDNKRITIIEKQGSLVIYVLDRSLYGERVSDTKYSFKDCHLWPLRFPNDKKPFLRILAAHCRYSFADAYRLKMIDFETFRMGYRCSIRLLNASPDGGKAKVFEWFERNEKLCKYNQS